MRLEIDCAGSLWRGEGMDVQATLVTLGVVAVMAAIVGGGLKAVGVEVPVFGSIPRQVLLGIFGLALIVVGLVPWQGWSPRPEDGDKGSDVAVPATQPWTDTSIVVEAGEELNITAEGEIHDDVENHPQRTFGPDGVPDTDNQHTGDPFKAEGFNHAALVGRIGEAGDVFEVGAELTCMASSGGPLFLSINDGLFTDNDGEYNATIVVGSPSTGSRSASSSC